MRSSVSAILSDPAPDTTMSFPDYGQSSADHATLLVLCQHIGHQMGRETFLEVVDIISSVREVKVTDKNGGVRSVKVRYADTYPAENNEWGEFQVVNIDIFLPPSLPLNQVFSAGSQASAGRHHGGQLQQPDGAGRTLPATRGLQV